MFAIDTRSRTMAVMPSRSKRKSPGKAKRSARPRSAVPRPTAKPFLRFYHSAGLREKTLSVLGALERAHDATSHRAALADIVTELTNSGMDYYFMKPLKLVKAGFIVEQSAKLGMAGAQQVMGSVLHNFIGRMDRPQLLFVCGYIRQLML
jgi:hypothetical protein